MIKKSKQILLDGYRFASPDEAKRYEWLKNLEINGTINNLKVHPKFILSKILYVPGLYNVYRNGLVNSVTFTPDFMYTLQSLRIVEDVKGKVTPKNRQYTLKPDFMVRLKWFLLNMSYYQFNNVDNNYQLTKDIYTITDFRIYWHDKYTAKQKREDLIRWGIE